MTERLLATVEVEVEVTVEVEVEAVDCKLSAETSLRRVDEAATYSIVDSENLLLPTPHSPFG